MRKSRIETAETRQRIIDVAARKFRLNGITATGLHDVMSDAGLTHGGFYRHFESKDQLVAEACAVATKKLVVTLEDAASESDGEDGFRAIVERYVSTIHRDDVADGCPLSGMGSELARCDENTRVAASRGFSKLIDLVAKQLGRQRSDSTESRAVFAVAAMIGAVTMSRILTDSDASTSVLNHVREHLDAI
ncbi:TetR/AcrR family transcriptional regulator (plasmid) [Paraburkholderia sp. FT54]|uniref:TetR/AcrR family transcriptional regulator n=1 Tax=Paraburkholderia sp. FT54 TaxID=3074437 RepID=UPI002878084E|nr:TetR/AcrR family transcriptional regulator [Paraburkholderia sp. FT54]WNC95211.1 TetR/AcrR family transcriptional regulator [Paraburkholderia sp. FT54]